MSHSRRDVPALNWRQIARLLRYALPYRTGWSVILALTFATTFLSLATPWPLKVLVDNVMGDQPPGRLIELLPGASSKPALAGWVALAGVLIFRAGALVDAVLTQLWVRVGQRMVYDLGASLLSRLLRRSLPFHARHPVGDSMARITSNTWCVSQLVDSVILNPLRALLMTAVALAIMWPMDWRLTLVSLAAAPLMALGAFFMGRHVRAASRTARDVESRIQAHVHQTLSGIHVVQAFGQEERQDERFRTFAGQAIRARRRGVLFSSLSSLTTGAITTAGTAVVLFVGAHRVLDGSLTVGSLLVFIAYLHLLHGQMKAVMASYRMLQNRTGEMERVLEVLESAPEIAEAARPVHPARVRGDVTIENVTFGYEPAPPEDQSSGPRRAILHDVSLSASAGETVAIVGQTGAGKSTLVNLIPRLIDPWQGRVTLDGHDLRALPLKFVRQQAALVMQEPFLFPVSIAQNIAFARPDATLRQIRDAAVAANADAFISRLPDGYDTVIGERGITLSGGERQRLSIARALLKDAPILILDEPTSALDAETEALLMDALERLMAGRTTFVIAHRLSTIRNADRIVLLEHGRVRETGSHDELMRGGGVYAEMNHASAQPRGVVLAG